MDGADIVIDSWRDGLESNSEDAYFKTLLKVVIIVTTINEVGICNASSIQSTIDEEQADLEVVDTCSSAIGSLESLSIEDNTHHHHQESDH